MSIETSSTSVAKASCRPAEPGKIFALMDLVVLRARLENARDLDPPMSSLCLGELIYQVGRQAVLIADKASRHVANKPITPPQAVAFLTEAARYFRNRPDGGEDMAFWSNIGNAEACEKIIALLGHATEAPPVGSIGAVGHSDEVQKEQP